MKLKILLMCLAAMIFIGCHSAPLVHGPVNNEESRLPKFEARDSAGNLIDSDQLAQTLAVVAFFDPNSILAWRTLSKLSASRQSQKDAQIFIVGIASSKVHSADEPNINSLRKEYQILFPVISDEQRRLSQLFQAPNCCDYLYIYNRKGILKSAQRLSESYAKLDHQITQVIGDLAAETSVQTSPSDLCASLTIKTHEGIPESLPLAARGFTVVNLFDQFCTECPTGGRFQTLDRVAHLSTSPSQILVIFSERNFSIEDVSNFRTILSPPYSLVQGNIERAKPYLIKEKLLVVFDAQRNLAWQERPGMTEEEIFSDLSRLMRSSAQ